MSDSTQLIYCYDPMCSWRWGFQPAWNALQAQLTPLIESGDLEIHYLLGGLAKDSDQPMPVDMQQMLQSTWRRIEEQLGTVFNYDFWRDCAPRRSTYPACRACLAAREDGLEMAMISAIQQAYYLEAKNPSDLSTLIECAKNIGIEPESFEKAMEEIKSSKRLEKEIHFARQLGLNSFPSLAVVSGDKIASINLDYQNPQIMAAEITQVIAKLG